MLSLPRPNLQLHVPKKTPTFACVVSFYRRRQACIMEVVIKPLKGDHQFYTSKCVYRSRGARLLGESQKWSQSGRWREPDKLPRVCIGCVWKQVWQEIQMHAIWKDSISGSAASILIIIFFVTFHMESNDVTQLQYSNIFWTVVWSVIWFDGEYLFAAHFKFVHECQLRYVVRSRACYFSSSQMRSAKTNWNPTLSTFD